MSGPRIDEYDIETSTTNLSSLARGDRIGRKKHVYCQHFDSLHELEEAKVPKRNMPQFKSSVLDRGFTGRRSRDWFGVSGGFEEIQRLTHQGWKAGEQKMRKMAEPLMPEINPESAIALRRRRKRRRGDMGSSVDMDQVYQGRLDIAWTKMEHITKKDRSTKTVAIFIDAACSAGVDADRAMWRGAAAFVLTDFLMKSGYSVAIYVGQTGAGTYVQDNTNDLFCASVKVKDYQTHLSDEHLAIMASVGFFRGYGFKQILLRDTEVSWGFGRPIDDPDVLPMDLKRDKEAGGMVVRIGNDVLSQRDAAALLRNVKAELERRREAA